VFEESFAAVETLPIGRRTNEPKRGGREGFGECRVRGCNEIELFQLLLFERAALGLNFAELLQSLK
jgi:hypothetical protein